MVLFKDLNKPCTDLLARDFPHDRDWEVEFKHQAKNPIFTQTAYLSAPGKVEAMSAIKHIGEWGSAETKLGSSMQSVELLCKPSGLPGMILGTKLEHKPNNHLGLKHSAELSLELEPREKIVERKGDIIQVATPKVIPHVRLSVNPLQKDWSASATAAVNVCKMAVARLGMDISGATDLRGVRYSVGASYTQTGKDLTWVGSVVGSHAENRPFGKITTAVHAKSNAPGAAELGAEVSYSVKAAQSDVAFVGLWYLDQPVGGGRSNTTLKMKLTKDAKIAGALTHKFSDLMTATFGAQVDTMKPDSLKYGVKLNIAA